MYGGAMLVDLSMSKNMAAINSNVRLNNLIVFHYVNDTFKHI